MEMQTSEETYRHMLEAKIPSELLNLFRKMLKTKHSYIMNYLLQALRRRLELLQVRSKSFNVAMYSPVISMLLDEIWVVLESTGFGISEVIKQREYNVGNRDRRNLVLLDAEVRSKIVDLILSRLSGHITPTSLNVRPVYSAGVNNSTIYINGRPVLQLVDTTYRKEILGLLKKNITMFSKWCDDS